MKEFIKPTHNDNISAAIFSLVVASSLNGKEPTSNEINEVKEIFKIEDNERFADELTKAFPTLLHKGE